jgi:hypothetical protein
MARSAGRNGYWWGANRVVAVRVGVAVYPEGGGAISDDPAQVVQKVEVKMQIRGDSDFHLVSCRFADITLALMT